MYAYIYDIQRFHLTPGCSRIRFKSWSVLFLLWLHFFFFLLLHVFIYYYFAQTLSLAPFLYLFLLSFIFFFFLLPPACEHVWYGSPHVARLSQAVWTEFVHGSEGEPGCRDEGEAGGIPHQGCHSLPHTPHGAAHLCRISLHGKNKPVVMHARTHRYTSLYDGTIPSISCGYF